MTIYPNRYQDQKEKIGNEIIVKVEGGYALMSPSEYQVWCKQK